MRRERVCLCAYACLCCMVWFFYFTEKTQSLFFLLLFVTIRQHYSHYFFQQHAIAYGQVYVMCIHVLLLLLHGLQLMISMGTCSSARMKMTHTKTVLRCASLLMGHRQFMSVNKKDHGGFSRKNILT